jgi:RNA polymerase sigma-70 factor, ECF subfamily
LKHDEFNTLLQTYGDLLYRMALHLTGGKEAEARDLVQDGFLRVWRSWDHQRPENVRGWMYRILHNLYMDALRRKARQPTVSLDAAPDDLEGGWERVLPCEGPAPTAGVEQEEIRREVQAALARLPEEFRIPVILCDLESLSYEEIAAVVGCPVGTVRSRIHRGRRALRRALVHFEFPAAAQSAPTGDYYAQARKAS